MDKFFKSSAICTGSYLFDHHRSRASAIAFPKFCATAAIICHKKNGSVDICQIIGISISGRVYVLHHLRIDMGRGGEHKNEQNKNDFKLGFHGSDSLQQS